MFARAERRTEFIKVVLQNFTKFGVMADYEL